MTRRRDIRPSACVREADLCAPGGDRFEGPAKRAIECGRNRLIVAGVLFSLGFVAIGARLVDLALPVDEGVRHAGVFAKVQPAPARSGWRADIVDRNGVLLATSLPVASLFADPRDISDPAAAAAQLADLLPGLDRAETEEKLRSDRRFVWLRRDLTPRQQAEVTRLGVPGLHLRPGHRRVYPHGRLGSHLLGFADTDNRGLAGIERRFDARLGAGATAPLKLSIDIRVQHVLRQELAAAFVAQGAKGASGLVLDVRTGEVVAAVSLPDFDPNRPMDTPAVTRFNRNTLGVYEMGSTFKIFTVALALENGIARLSDRFDVRAPIRVARFTIDDLHGLRRRATVADIFIQSSNIGAALLARATGGAAQQDFLARLGLFAKPAIELYEVGAPIRPKVWRKITTLTVAFGHGIAVSPLQLASAAAAVVNGGIMRRPTLLRRPADAPANGVQVLSAATSEKMRGLMRRVVSEGTGRNAAAPGYVVGGKTGTAEKAGPGGYDGNRLVSSFLGVFPIDAPRYVVLAIIDEPKGVDGNPKKRTGGWVAAPVVARFIARAGMMLGVEPVEETRPDDALPALRIMAGGNRIAVE